MSYQEGFANFEKPVNLKNAKISEATIDRNAQAFRPYKARVAPKERKRQRNQK